MRFDDREEIIAQDNIQNIISVCCGKRKFSDFKVSVLPLIVVMSIPMFSK